MTGERSDDLIHRRFGRQAARHGDDPAVTARGTTVGHGELGRRANRLANRLGRLGVGCEDVVATIVGDSPDTVVAVLGAWTAGAAVLVIDPRTPVPAVAARLTATGARVVVGPSAAVLAHADRCEAVVMLDVDRAELAAEPDHPPEVTLTPDALAGLVCLDGPGGEPVPVGLTHRAILDTVPPTGTRPTVLLTAAASSAAFLADLAYALVHGGRLILCAPGVVLDPPRLVELLGADPADHAHLRPVVAETIGAYLRQTGLPSPVRRIVVDADPLDPRPGRRSVLSEYAPAEVASGGLVREAAGAGWRPAPGVRVVVVDPMLRPVPPGGTGELCLAGAGTARGYHRHPAATAARFVPDVEGPPGSRMVRTALLARARDDGTVAVLGRVGDVDGTTEAAVAPATSAADLVAALWAELLGQPPADADEDFFRAGGGWTSAAQLGTAVATLLGTDLPQAAVFAAPTVRGITAAAADPRRPGTPLSPLQRRLWLLHRMNPDDPGYHIPVLVHLSGELRVDLLRAALTRLVARHEALRLRITVGPGGSPRQSAPPPGPVDLTIVEVAGRDPAALIAERIRLPFDLTAGPLFRAVLLRHGAGRADLLLVAHHIVFDGWSETVLARELGVIYSALLSGVAPELPALPVGFTAVAARQAGHEAAGDLDPHLDYWRTTLADPPAPVDLPGTGRTPRGHTGTAHRHFAGAGVRDLARRHRTTPFTVLLTVLTALLGRWTRLPELIVGVPYAGRDRAELDDLIGFLVRTVPLRLPATPERSFAEAVRDTGGVLRAGVTHSAAPYDRIVAELGLGGNPRRDPLFRVWFNLLGAPAEPPRMTGLRTRMGDPPISGALFDLNVYLTEEHDGGFHLRLVHDRDVVDDTYVAAFADQYLLLIDAACADPEQPVGAPDLTSAASRAYLPDPAAVLPASQPPDLLPTLGAVARRHPSRVAVSDPAGSMSHAEVHARAAELARRLAEAGVERGDVVPLLATRSATLVPALLGVIASGATFTILDAGHPAARLAEQVRQVGARIGVADPAAGPVPAAIREVCAHWVPGPDRAPVEPTDPTTDPRSPDTPLYVAFTSGTTGGPRGIVGDTAPLTHFLRWYVDRFDIGPSDRFAVLSGLAHDPLLRDLLTPLWVGASACVPDPRLLRAPGELRRWLAAERVTIVHLGPAVARLLARSRPIEVASVRLVVLGGDTVREADVTGVRGWAPNAVVVNAYGSTETPQIAGLTVIAEPTGSAPDRPIPIAAGAPGTQVLVVDPHGRPLAPGERGQIMIRGRNLARGYLDTRGASRFVPDPVPGHRRFMTGDAGRHEPDGAVTVLGRDDGQVKISGVRFELAEIENRLRGHPAVADAVVGPRFRTDAETTLVACVVAAPGAEPDEASLRAFLRGAVPETVIPSRISVVDTIPLTVNGKVDRAALPEPPPPRPVASTAPASDLERVVADVWCQVLGVERVATDVNFFDAGGGSLAMAAVHVALEGRLGRAVPIVLLFAHPTVRDLALRLTAGAPPDPAVSAAAARRRSGGTAALRDRRLAARGRERNP